MDEVRPARLRGPATDVTVAVPQHLEATGVRTRPATRADRAFVLETARRLTPFEAPPSRTREQLIAADTATLAAYFGWLRRARRLVMTLLHGRPRAEVLLALSPSGEPLGFAYLHRATDYFSRRDVSYLSVIAVAAQAEGRGVGSALMHAVERWALARSHHLVLLNVFAANAVARSFYEHHGYVGETVRYVKVLASPAAEPGPSGVPAAPLPGPDVRL